ncbi:hypothetical protein HJFPF1_02818 [Paramyrothecium foliicola]|nr:hypothetical protein HJFPF1_02818 [Paramyrothecium foliicola]
MACLSRGFLLPGLRSVTAAPRSALPNLSASRAPFSTTILRFQKTAAESIARRAKPPAPSPKNNAPRAPAQQAAPSRYAFIKSLASKSTPTTLYEGPSHFWFYFGCWSSGLSIAAWSLTTGPGVMNQPEGVPRWVGLAFGASYMLLMAMGFYLISKTPNIVKTIRLIPNAVNTGQPQLEVTVKRMFPFLTPKVVVANIDNVSLKSRFSLPDAYVPHLKRLELQRQEEEKQKALQKFDMEHILTMPFRRLGRAFVGLFQGVRAAWTDMGMGFISVDGKAYKVDITQGFAHDGFRTLEKLVRIVG